MAQITAQVLHPDERAGVAVQILRERNAAHCAARSEAGLIARHAALLVVSLEHRQMRRHFARQLRIVTRTGEQRYESAKEILHHSPRSARDGLIRSARRAGTMAATSATTANTAAAPAKVAGSSGRTPNNKLSR
jgi:hypothetical protein